MITDPEATPKPGQTDPNPTPEAIRGVTKLAPRMDRRSPFGVQWYTGTGRHRKFFASEAACDRKLADLVKKAKRGVLRQEMSQADQAAWRAFREAVGATPWQDVVAGWREHAANSGRLPCTLTVAAASKLFLDDLETRRGQFSPGYFTHVKQKVTLFSYTFGVNLLGSVTPEDIEDWIDDLGFEANGTFNMYRKMVRMFYEFFRKQVKNPCDEVPARSETISAVGILTVQQTRDLFAYAAKHHRDALGRLALEAFAGLRFSSAFRLEKSDINFEDRGILLPAHKLKTGRRHYIDGLPDNLWLWLKATNDGCWAMESSEWMHLKSKLFTDSKVPHPRNCLRHSFCTYHVAAHKNPGLTSTILCHRNQQKLWSNYNGIAKQAEGLAYFEIKP